MCGYICFLGAGDVLQKDLDRPAPLDRYPARLGLWHRLEVESSYELPGGRGAISVSLRGDVHGVGDAIPYTEAL